MEQHIPRANPREEVAPIFFPTKIMHNRFHIVI